MKGNGLSYRESGVDIDSANAAKQDMKRIMKTDDPRVLNTVGAFASLFEASFPGLREPVLVLKTEEPGTKQKLAVENKRYTSICYDMVNHLINDIAVMGATPLAVQDAIICGKLEPEVVTEMVRAMAQACRDQGCTLTGGETSEQPGVIPAGTYILTSSIVGVVDRLKVIDGSRIANGDTVLAVASNGLHTNGYSLARRLLVESPSIAGETVGGESFLEAILKPHTCYFGGLRDIFDLPELHGMAHITGGGIAENLDRVLPAGLDAAVDLSRIRIPPVFEMIRRAGSVPDSDMLRTFNMGVGLCIVADPSGLSPIQGRLQAKGFLCYPVGEIVPGTRRVTFRGNLTWKDAKR